MAQKVIWTISAYHDLQNIVDFISEDSMYYAMAFYNDVMDKAQTLTELPQRGRVVPEMGDPHLRELFIHRLINWALIISATTMLSIVAYPQEYGDGIVKWW